MNGLMCAAWAFAGLAQAVGSTLPMARSSRIDVSRIAAELELTPADSSRWLAALGVTSSRAEVERVLIVSRSAKILAAQDGDRFGVTFNVDIARRVRVPDADLVLIHNHPDNASPSLNDLVQLAQPGVTAVVAVGHDGSIYMAGRGAGFDGKQFERQYGHVRSVVQLRLRLECGARQIRRSAADAHYVHVIALALAEAGLIEYGAVMSRSARSSFDPASIALGGVAASAAGVLGRRHLP